MGAPFLLLPPFSCSPSYYFRPQGEWEEKKSFVEDDCAPGESNSICIPPLAGQKSICRTRRQPEGRDSRFALKHSVVYLCRIVTSKSLRPQFTFPRQLFLLLLPPVSVCRQVFTWPVTRTVGRTEGGKWSDGPTEEVATDDAPLPQERKKEKAPFYLPILFVTGRNYCDSRVGREGGRKWKEVVVPSRSDDGGRCNHMHLRG